MTLHLTAARRRQEREHNENAWLAWHVAAMQRAKKMPKMQALMVKASSGAPRPRQTWQEQLAIMTKWAERSQLAQQMRDRDDGR